jgi:adenylate cyclase
MSLFTELKRRNVIRVAIAYIAGAWLLTEVSGTLFPAFGIPDWGVRFVVIVLALGFLPALIISWAYELTPEGLKREKDVVRDTSITHLTAKRLDGITIGLIVVALAFILADRFWPGAETVEQTAPPTEVVTQPVSIEPETPPTPDTSIAVLPFVNMSDDPGNEYFSDGISEELLNVLVRVEGLRVVSRTSSFAFKGTDISLPAIATQLNVSHVLEGSVRKAGNKVRVTAQLIDVRTDSHLWSETYDRELEDIFAIQDEISGRIVEALKMALGASAQGVMANIQKPTQNLEAYELYLRGRYFWQRRSEDDIRRAINLFEEATGLDPTFARAWSSLAAAHITLPTYSDALDLEHFPLAVSFAQKALALDDTLAEAYAVLGDVARSHQNLLEAEAHYLLAIGHEPKNSTAHLWYGEHLMVVGRIRDALEETLVAYQLDPLHPGTNSNLSWAYIFLKDADNALKYGAAAWDLGNVRGLYSQLLAYLYLEDFDRASDVIGRLENPRAALFTRVLEAKRDTQNKQSFANFLTEYEAVLPRSLLWSGNAGIGRVDEAFRLARQALDSADTPINAWWTLWRYEMAPFRQDPQFFEFVTDLGLVENWREYGWPDACQPEGDSVICE